MKKTSFSDKIKEGFAKVKIVKNLARQKFVWSFLLGLIQSSRVQFCQVAQHLNDEAQAICNVQSLKSRGFDLESTHLKDLAKLKK